MPYTVARPPFPRGVVAFTALYLAAAIVAAVAVRNREFVFYLGVMFVLIAVVAVLHRRIGLSAGVLWGLSLWGLAHMAGGLVPVPESWPINGNIWVLYSWWMIPGVLKFDHVVHAFGFGVTTCLCWEGLQAALRAVNGDALVQPTLGLLTLCAAAGMGFGALNEVVEFIATLTMPETNVGGYQNTGWDLVANLAGSIVAVLLIRARNRGNAPVAEA
jgi:hypothetical protein